MSEKKRILSGITSSGKLTLGNYIGALDNWVKLADEYDAFYFVADLHAITVRQEPAELRKLSLQSIAQYIACGLDPTKNTLFIQSHISEHAELAWVLSCMTYMGELNRMTQFKDKSAKRSDNLNAGLYTYPVLMAADILLYQADLVPVGDDQKQHLEIARDIATRFNNRYSETFVLPEVYNPKVGARIMSLQDPLSKMSKSDENINASVYITDEPDVIIRKFKRAVTDSAGVIQISDEQPGVKNLLTIYSALTKQSLTKTVEQFTGKGYGDLKMATAEVTVETLKPIREKYLNLLDDKKYLESVYREGAEKARRVAVKTLRKVYKKTGFVPR